LFTPPPNSMEQNPFWKGNSSASQISYFLWNPKVHYVFIRARPLTLFGARIIRSTILHATDLRSILISHYHLRLIIASDLYASCISFPIIIQRIFIKSTN
jgi:hypothetical protein